MSVKKNKYNLGDDKNISGQDNEKSEAQDSALAIATRDMDNMKGRLVSYNKKVEPIFEGWLRQIDKGAKYLTDKNYKTGNQPIDAARGPLVFGIWVFIVVFVFFGGWAVLAPIDSAAVARGTIAVASNKKVIQHLEGGVIAEILVKDGDLVKEGQPLIKLNPATAESRQGILLSQLRNYKGAEVRLLAERDGSPQLDFSTVDVLKDANNPEVAKIISSQTLYFESRKKTIEGQLGVMQQKIEQSSKEIGGLMAQEKAADTQLKFLNEEIGTVSKLVQTGQALKPRLLSLERQAAEIGGNKGQYTALIAKAKQNIAENQLQMINIKNDFLSKVASELRDTQGQIADTSERLEASTDILNRIVITAPQDGKITNLQYHTVGGVIQPGAAIMEIVPQHDKFVVEAQVMIHDINVVHAGLPAKVRLSAYKARRVPMVEGKVVDISADRLVDKNQNMAYYLARIELDQKQLEKLKGVELYPGMPADVLIVTGKRTLFSYLMDPLNDVTFKAFKEE